MRLDAHKASSLKMRLTAALASLDAARSMVRTADQVEALEDVERSIMLAVEENGALRDALYDEHGALQPDDASVCTGTVSDAIRRADEWHTARPTKLPELTHDRPTVKRGKARK